MISSLPPCPPPSFHLQRSKQTFKSPATSNTSFPPFHSLLHNCSSMQQLHQIHALMLKTNAIADPLHLSKLLSFSSSPDSGDLHYAFKLFSLIPQRNSFHWNTLIHGFSLSSSPEQSLLLFVQLLEEEPSLVNPYTLPPVLRACGNMSAAFEGIQVHCYAVKCEAVADLFVLNSLIQMYFKCRLSDNACIIFDRMPERNVVSWNCVIGGFAEMGTWGNVKSLFWDMVEDIVLKPNALTLVRMVTACTKSGDFESGKLVHRYIEENMVSVCLTLGNALMNMYAKFGEMGEARRLYDRMSDPDVVSSTTLVSGYASIGLMELASEVFDSMPIRNTVAWNAMMYGYVLNGYFDEAISLFKEMLILGAKTDEATMITILSACSKSGNLLIGRVVHGYIYKLCIFTTQELLHSLISVYSKSGVMEAAELLLHKMDIKNEVSWTLMMEGYVKTGQKEVALEIFHNMPRKDLASWNALITVLVQCNFFNDALTIFEDMQRMKVIPNCITLVSSLSACAGAGALELGKWIHAYIKRNDIEMGATLCSALIDMYAKCGCIELSLEVFESMQCKDLVWSTIIGGLSMNGHSKLALEYFERMIECGGVPDSITFIGVLSACSHAGLIEEGKHYFLLMTEVYGIPPASEHCGCMVDLFARQGFLIEAKDFIDGISISSNRTAIWGALLGACSIYGNLELAEYAARHLLAINPTNSGAYVLLSNVYAKASRWSDVRKVRNMMKEQGIEKIPGCSSIEVNGVVHEFFVGDFSHSQGEEIYMMLNRLEKMLQNQMISS
ncbi:TPR-like protein [Dioscorea alata]|uniref:TPR-like protein n=1 Tax=Dioscorea alata TaxID=55571 RepID=A0ACB7UZG8_DIOAL|nr:TPR-like protein [Dioscorea alata]